MKRGGKAVCQALSAALGDRGLSDEVAIKGTGCLKQCSAGPNIVVMPDKTRYSRIQAAQIPKMIDKHFPDQSLDEKQLTARDQECEITTVAAALATGISLK
jgi:(2Fe-2S) ferredoxin